VVLDEGQDPVLARVEALELLHAHPVGLEHVDVVLGGVADLHVAQHEPVGAVGADADVLHGADRALVPRGDTAGVDDHVVGTGARPLDL